MSTIVAQVLTPKSASALVKYKEMVASGADEAQVRLRMANDGVPTSVADQFLLEAATCQSPIIKNPGHRRSRSFKSSVLTEQYKKMLENGVPASTVRQKMARSGMDTAEINAFFDKEK